MMMYDDVDMNILDSKDTFGVIKPAELRTPMEEDKVDFKPKHKSPFKRDSPFPTKARKRPDDEDCFESKFKFTRKSDDTDSSPELKPKFSRKKMDDDDSSEMKLKFRKNDEIDFSAEPPKVKFSRKKIDDDDAPEKLKFSRKKIDDEDAPEKLKFSRKKIDDEESAEKFKFSRKQPEDDKPKRIESLPDDFKYKTAVSFQEKLSVLDERDKYLRESVFKTGTKNMSVIVNGTCPDMCPERERLLREINCSFSIFEGQIVDHEMHVVPEFLVKEYSRSSADQDEPLPHELRPEPVLMDTMNHILLNIIPKIEENIDITEWYHFSWDRLRSLRKDIIQQQLCSRNIVRILEQSARFHICCGDLLFGADPKVFDEKINAENLVNCLQMLISMYEDLEKKGIRCENESEFRIYMMLLLLDSGDVPDVIRWNDEDSKKYAREAKDIFFAFKHNLYTRFFKLVKKTTYLNACILQRYFSTLKTQILNVLVNSYSSGSHMSKFPLSFVKKILEFDTDEETVAFIESHGFVVNYQTNEARGSKSSFTIPEVKVTCGSSYILRAKRLPILEAVTKIRNYSPKMTLTKVHSSFNEYDKLNEAAWTAEDQKQTIIQLFGDIYKAIDEGDGPSRVPAPQNISPKPVFTFNVEPKPIKILEEPKKSPVKEFSFSFKKPQVPEPLTEPKVPIPFTFTFPKAEPKPQPPRESSPVEVQVKTESPVPSPQLKSPKQSELYDPEDASSSDDETETSEESVIEPTPVRNSEEVVHSLTNALQQFENLYTNFFSATQEQNEHLDKLATQRENRSLRRTVKKRLKRNNAKKYARLWKKKVDEVRKKRDDFVDIIHLPLDQYLTLWGSLKSKNALPKSIVKETNDNRTAVQWSSNILSGKSLGVKYIGDKLAQLIVTNVRTRSSMLKLKMKTILCWKILLSLPNPANESFYAFVSRVCEFCQLLFYQNKTELGSVQMTRNSGVNVYVAVDVKTGAVDADADVAGVTSLVVYVCEKQETMDEFLDRLNSLVAHPSVHPVFLNVIAFNGCYQDVSDHLSILKRKKLIVAWKYTKWENFFTFPKAILNGAHFVPWTPTFEVKSMTSFIEQTSGDFFLSVRYLWNNTLQNNPLTYIKLHNSFLTKLKQALVTENLRKYNLSEEFVPHVIGVKDSQNTLTEPALITLLGKYLLVGYTKWPPKSVSKMVKLLTKYCAEIDPDTALLANVLRLVAPREDLDVHTISANAPWLKVVELWSKYNVYAVLKRENVKNVFVIYDQCKIKEITDGTWIYNSPEIAPQMK